MFVVTLSQSRREHGTCHVHTRARESVYLLSISCRCIGFTRCLSYEVSSNRAAADLHSQTTNTTLPAILTVQGSFFCGGTPVDKIMWALSCQRQLQGKGVVRNSSVLRGILCVVVSRFLKNFHACSALIFTPALWNNSSDRMVLRLVANVVFISRLQFLALG